MGPGNHLGQVEHDAATLQLTPLVTAIAPGLLALPGVRWKPPGSCWSPPVSQPRPAQVGSILRPALRRRPDPRLIRPHRPAPAAPGRGPPGQQRPVAHRLVRMGCHQPTKDYVARRTAEGKTKTEIMRCLKRYIAREVFPLLVT